MEDITKIHRDFELFSRALIASNDVDPVYPIVPKLIKMGGYEKHWFVFSYVAFYSLESGIIMCNEFRNRNKWTYNGFADLRYTTLKKFGHERRGTARNVAIQTQMFSNIIDFIDLWMNEALSKDNQHFRKRIQETISNHGGWASFKIAELFEKSLGYKQLYIPDLGLDGRDPNSTDGPVAGLRWLYGMNNQYDKDWFEVWNRYGHSLANEWGVDIGEVETCLCKFHKFKTGKYYIGHDVDEFYELKHVLEPGSYETMMGDIFDDRMWKSRTGIIKNDKSAYLKAGKIINSEFSVNLPKIDTLEILLNTD